MEVQHLRSFVKKQDTVKTCSKIRSVLDSFVDNKRVDSNCSNAVKADAAKNSPDLIKDQKAMKSLLEFATHFGDFKSAFPKLKYNATMDFVC